MAEVTSDSPNIGDVIPPEFERFVTRDKAATTFGRFRSALSF